MNLYHYLTQKLLKRKHEVLDWIQEKLQHDMYPIYMSVDVRYSGYKIYPIDNNIFPAGFNNLSVDSIQQAKNIFQKEIIGNLNNLNDTKNKSYIIGIIVESHTRNTYYADSIKSLIQIVSCEQNKDNLICNKVICGHLNEAQDDFYMKCSDDTKIKITKIKKQNDKIIIADHIPDVIILNDDLSSITQNPFHNLQQNIMPNPKKGWWNRTKQKYFFSYKNIIHEFCKDFDLDHFFFTVRHDFISDVNFKEKQGIENLLDVCDNMIKKITQDYKERNIDDIPYLVIKPSKGTYGMGIMNLYDVAQLHNINKKIRKKMHIIKGNRVNSEIVVQEGIKTIDLYQQKIAEQMFYFVGSQVVSNLMRVHENKTIRENLNSVGAQFFEIEPENIGQFIYQLIARLSVLAAIKE